MAIGAAEQPAKQMIVARGFLAAFSTPHLGDLLQQSGGYQWLVGTLKSFSGAIDSDESGIERVAQKFLKTAFRQWLSR